MQENDIKQPKEGYGGNALQARHAASRVWSSASTAASLQSVSDEYSFKYITVVRAKFEVKLFGFIDGVTRGLVPCPFIVCSA